jgi:hypothetical protein
MTLRIGLSILTGEFERNLVAMQEPIARSMSSVMSDVAAEAKIDGRAEIARAGFSKRWQGALRVDQYPKAPRISIDSAVVVRSKIPYAGVFEDGATITGKPLMWLPTPSAPKRIGRNTPMTPENYNLNIGDLQSMTSAKGTPLLVAQVRMPRATAAPSIRALKRGIAGTRGEIRTVPMFVGIKKAQQKERLNIREMCEAISKTIPQRYAAKFRSE